MRTVFDDITRNDLTQRIDALHEKSKVQWGKMNVQQMIQHCILSNEMILENKKYKRAFIGVLLGKMILKKEMQEGSIMRRNSPTIPELVVKESNADITLLKNKWKASLASYTQYASADLIFVHAFFGKMTKEQVGYLVYKHTDHHLRQFDC